ncbi:30S ribosome-binding factor RbfA [bacterium]|nr:30S ribosome-binding factor RbfA [bacterium]
MKAKRTDRLASQIIREISEILQRKLSDPRLQWVTLTRAEVSPNMREAKIFVRTLEIGKKEEQTLEALRHATGFIRRELGHRLAWRVIPEVVFRMDKEAEQTEKVLRIISELSHERSAKDGGTEA